MDYKEYWIKGIIGSNCFLITSLDKTQFLRNSPGDLKHRVVMERPKYYLNFLFNLGKCVNPVFQEKVRIQLVFIELVSIFTTLRRIIDRRNCDVD